jgi:hypothetical protein
MFTKTPVAAGSKRKEPQGPAQVIQALRKAIPPPQEVGENRGRAAEDPHLHLAAMGGSRGQKVLEVRIAAVEEEVGEEGAAAVEGKGPESFLIEI